MRPAPAPITSNGIAPNILSPMSRAVLTMVYNESVFLPIWLRYYSRFFAPEDIYVLDHQSDDGSTNGGGFVRVPLEHETTTTATGSGSARSISASCSSDTTSC